MLTIYRRHTKSCDHRDEGREYRRCKCPIWVDGLLGSQDMRESLKLRDWQQAQVRVRDAEAAIEKHAAECALIAGMLSGKARDCTCGADAVRTNSEPMTLERGWEKFLADAKARELRPPTLYKYKLLKRIMLAFAQQRGLRYLREFDLEMARDFRQSWKLHNLAALKRLEYLRAFFRFAHDAAWITANPAKKIKSPKIVQRPTEPFTRDEMTRIIAACDAYAKTRAGSGNAARLRALVLLLRFSGLRIRDAVALSRERIADGKLLLYTAKTGTPVYCPLPDAVTQALEAIPTTSQRFFFWTGQSEPKSAVGGWQRSLSKLFKLAKVAKGHAHRFRDTFAVELLLAGVPLERVSVLLGHQSTRITERYYSPWVRARQEQLEADVRRAWMTDLLSQSETKGTPEVHGGTARPN